jgi:hypothetical protein
MTEATIHVGGAESAVRPTTGQGSGRRLRQRHLWIIPGLAIAIVANELGKANGVGILLLIAFGLVPDVPRLFGIGRTGQASSVARAVFNVLHHPAVPAAAVAVAATGFFPPVFLVGALVWLGHVVIGWGVGDVPRHGAPRPSA